MARVNEPLLRLRIEFLEGIAQRAPEVLTSLELRRGNAEALRKWHHEYGLDVPWLHQVATLSLELWSQWPAGRARVWNMDGLIEERGFRRLPARGRLPKRPSEILVDPQHIEWLVDYYCLDVTFAELSDPPQTAQRAVAALARKLGLPPKSRKAQ